VRRSSLQSGPLFSYTFWLCSPIFRYPNTGFTPRRKARKVRKAAPPPPLLIRGGELGVPLLGEGGVRGGRFPHRSFVFKHILALFPQESAFSPTNPDWSRPRCGRAAVFRKGQVRRNQPSPAVHYDILAEPFVFIYIPGSFVKFRNADLQVVPVVECSPHPAPRDGATLGASGSSGAGHCNPWPPRPNWRF